MSKHGFLLREQASVAVPTMTLVLRPESVEMTKRFLLVYLLTVESMTALFHIHAWMWCALVCSALLSAALSSHLLLQSVLLT